MEATPKFCTICHVLKYPKDFSVHRAHNDGLMNFCKTCRSAKRRAERALDPEFHRQKELERRQANRPHFRNLCNTWRRNNLDKIEAGKLRNHYHITVEKKAEIFDFQEHQCPGCGTTDPPLGWALDHDHACCPKACRSCGKCIRGILCSTCNRGMGLLKDNRNILVNLAAYLENPPAKQVLI